MHILFITSTLDPKSGWGTYSRNTVKGFLERGHRVSILTHQQSENPMTVEAAVLPAPLHVLTSYLSLLRSSWVIAKAVRRHHPDVIHVLIEPYVIAMPLARFLVALPPWVMNLHGTYSVFPFVRRHSRLLMDLACRQAAAFLACSRYTWNKTLDAATQYASKEAVRSLKERTHLFRFGINAPIQAESETSEKNSRTILFVGEVKPRKGVKELVLACVEYAKESSVPLHLAIVGNTTEQSPYMKELRTLVETQGLQNIVTFYGQTSEEKLSELFRKSDLFMMLSKTDGIYFEGFGLVFLEANAHGIPVIGSRDSGCAEAIDEGKSGYVVDAFDQKMIVERMHWVLDEKRIDRAECRRWAEFHSISKQVDQIEMCYRSVLPTSSAKVSQKFSPR
ncbi:glycosyltransferase [Candidatus Peribacteria bacterium]|nr:glycosyltransferase [Candidatus Peribacteria bacterium]